MHFGEIGEQLRRSTVQVRTRGHVRGGGSGVIWRPDGLILTNAHVARGGLTEVELWDATVLSAQVAARDPAADLAALRVDATALPAAPIGDSARLAVGELVIAVGNPLGFRGALSTGIIHALGPMPGLGARSWVQTDVRLAPGNSGGPLANTRGEVIGVNTMIAGSIALAIPSHTAARFASGGPPPALGVVLRPVSLARDGMRRLGLLLLEVGRDTPAARASLIPGDVLTAAEGRHFRSPDDLPQALAASPGRLRLQFLRGARGPVRETTVVLTARAEAA